MLKRSLIIGLALALACLAAPQVSQAQVMATAPGDMSLGAADAPVTVTEYASVTCSHCANWHTRVYPEFKRRYIDTGRVRYVFRELPTPPLNLAAAGFILARCAGPDRYFRVVNALMRRQSESFSAPLETLRAIGTDNGVDAAAFDRCLTNDQAYEDLQARSDAAVALGVQGTPTFFVNSTRLPAGEASLEQLDTAIIAAEP